MRGILGAPREQLYSPIHSPIGLGEKAAGVETA
jgi:hypothetical protein